MSAATLDIGGPLRWSPPRTEADEVGARWADWGRWAAHRSGRLRRRLHAEVAQADALRTAWESLDDAALDARLAGLRRQVRLGRAAGDAARDTRVQALAAVAVAAQRAVGRRPYPVQMLAALAMHEGLVVQMAAGEGKTLAVALVAVLKGWRGLPCHVVTSNDYLAQRDVALMAPLFARCGVSAASAVAEMPAAALASAYAADLVYATSKQLLADHLCDQIALGGALDPTRRRIRAMDGAAPGPAIRTRGLHAAIVDEADSVLIDEANTPLIISAPQPNALLVEAVLAARAAVAQLQAPRDYVVDQRLRDIEFTEAGRRRVEELTDTLPPVWRSPQRRDDLLRQALSARELYQRDRHYVVLDGKVQILDESTGRVMPGRSWSYGLHQAIEAREDVEITPPTRTMARMSFQGFFRRYHDLGGASGTLQGVREEMWRTYGLLTFEVPTRVPSRLQVAAPRHFAQQAHKVAAVVEEVARLHALSRAVLVGTRRLSDSEVLQALLTERGLPCTVLNAKQHALEAEIVAQAGRPGCITVATNMAGRGTDIQLAAGVEADGGLHVLMVEPHESARVDWQLFGRAGRQGQAGRAAPFVALDDDLFLRHLPRWARPVLALLAHVPALRGPAVRALVPWAQRRAQRRAFLQRRYLQMRDRQLREQLAFAGDASS